MVRAARLLLAGYGLAALAAALLAAGGAGLVVVALGFWFGGAIAVAVLAVASAARTGPLTAADPADEAATLAEALRLWELDRAADSVASEPGRRDAAG